MFTLFNSKNTLMDILLFRCEGDCQQTARGFAAGIGGSAGPDGGSLRPAVLMAWMPPPDGIAMCRCDVC